MRNTDLQREYIEKRRFSNGLLSFHMFLFSLSFSLPFDLFAMNFMLIVIDRLGEELAIKKL